MFELPAAGSTDATCKAANHTDVVHISPIMYVTVSARACVLVRRLLACFINGQWAHRPIICSLEALENPSALYVSFRPMLIQRTVPADSWTERRYADDLPRPSSRSRSRCSASRRRSSSSRRRESVIRRSRAASSSLAASVMAANLAALSPSSASSAVVVLRSCLS